MTTTYISRSTTIVNRNHFRGGETHFNHGEFSRRICSRAQCVSRNDGNAFRRLRWVYAWRRSREQHVPWAVGWRFHGGGGFRRRNSMEAVAAMVAVATDKNMSDLTKEKQK
jgi:hypothetical protein